MDGCERLQNYVNEVLTAKKGKFPLTIIQACQRFVDDMGREEFYFDVDSANNAISYIEMFKFNNGEKAGQNVQLEPWQCFWVGSIFGWKWTIKKTRRFRYAYAQIPRKNGKSFIAVCIALLMLAPDGEPGAQVFLGATSKDDCKQILFEPATQILKACPEYIEEYGVDIGASRITVPDQNSFLTTVIRKPSDGSNPHCAIVDEYHQHDTSDQYDMFKTGMGARRQPLLHVVTTAGNDLGGPCKSEYDECKRVLNKEFEQDNKFILIFEPDDDDKWDEWETVLKVNPNIHILNIEALKADFELAKKSPEKQNIFRTKHCNQWVGSKVAWMNMVAWQRQVNKKLKIDDFIGFDCHISVDLASKKDLAAISILFKKDEQYYGFEYFYAPESAIESNDRYPRFVNRGEIVVTDGNMTDYAFIEKKILELVAKFNVLSVAYDPYQATYLVTRLQQKRINLVEYGHTVSNMSEPMKEFEALVLDGKYHHDNNQCMSWQMGNVAAKLDVKENIYPNKSNRNDERCKIDGVVAMIMCFGRWIDDSDEPSVYEERGLRQF